MGNILQFARCQTFMPCPKTAGPAHRALPSSRTPSRRFTYVKWGRLWLFKDILILKSATIIQYTIKGRFMSR